mmetsp:Transcript_23821/g.62366  ORF Transcript_23821/g.62366 Transcript_23821/m.62366 type:complete len:724 (-) Transcript_23821:95-2266(-)
MAIRFRDLQRLCDRVAAVSGRLDKSSLIRKWAHKPERWGSPDMKKAFKFLLPKHDSRIYNLQDKQLVKILARVYRVDSATMESDLHGESGVISETAAKFFPGTNPQPVVLTLSDVDDLLDQFSLTGTESRQVELFSGLAKVCTSHDIDFVVRLLKKDLRINALDKTVLDGLHDDAYEAFKRQKDVEALVDRAVRTSNASGAAAAAGLKPPSRRLSGSVKMGAPIEPMLAKQLKSLEQPFKPTFATGGVKWKGVAAEIKYDGERVQVHMNGGKYSYFSRSLKPSQPKVTSEIKDHVPSALADDVDNCILDAEVLLVDRTKVGHAAMLPFGSLGVHKKKGFANANVCLFVFDILWLNGELLIDKPFRERRRLLEKTVKTIPHRVHLSEFKFLKDSDEAKEMMETVVEHGLEGLMLKDVAGPYKPKGRHWLKVKRNYLSDESGNHMVDSLDLVVLGGYHGAGRKAGLLSSFLMGCQDPKSGRWKTVTKVANGFDDDQLDAINKKLKPLMKPCGAAGAVPDWLDVEQALIPPLVVTDPLLAPVWELGGAEFTDSERHTAQRISVRFPILMRERDDKDAAHANSLEDVVHIRDTSLARASGKQLTTAAKNTTKRTGPADDAPRAAKRIRTDPLPDVVTVDDDDSDDAAPADDGRLHARQGGLGGSVTKCIKRNLSQGAAAAAPSTTGHATVSPPDTRDWCQYGRGCYRKNPDHIRRFRHGDDRDSLGR